jgi:hypothetical protein
VIVLLVLFLPDGMASMAERVKALARRSRA